MKTNIAYGRFLEKGGDHATARKRYELALKSDKNSVDAILGIARLDQYRGRTAQAKQGFEKALKLNKNSVDALLGLARLDQLAGRHAQAEQRFKEALAIEPDDPHLLDALGLHYVNLKKWDEAVAALSKATNAAPKDKTYRYHLAIALAKSGDYRGSMPHFVASVGEAVGYYNIGYLLNEQGDSAAAETQFRRALSINPELKEARQMLSLIAQRQLQGRLAGNGSSRNSHVHSTAYSFDTGNKRKPDFADTRAEGQRRPEDEDTVRGAQIPQRPTRKFGKNGESDFNVHAPMPSVLTTREIPNQSSSSSATRNSPSAILGDPIAAGPDHSGKGDVRTGQKQDDGRFTDSHSASAHRSENLTPEQRQQFSNQLGPNGKPLR